MSENILFHKKTVIIIVFENQYEDEAWNLCSLWEHSLAICGTVLMQVILVKKKREYFTFFQIIFHEPVRFLWKKKKLRTVV